ncbi:MAG: choice-of-anchor L domain-containing protein, partial [Bacteroidales bacterium]|nr:choice-of-anchor L domain-containing protein [Bacteroidales bacterium]
DFLIGPGITVSNVTYRGQLQQFAYFSNGNSTVLGMDEGIILCTGTASNIAQNGSSFMSNSLGGLGVTELDSIVSPYTTNDGAVLEFDFIPLDTLLTFYYIFGSEEYPEFVCSSFNDVFAFLISGINPSGGMYVDKNIALVPGTDLPVAINTINPGVPGASYSASGCTSLSYSNLYINNNNSYQQPVFDGFTIPLVAEAKVIPCQTYHIKLCIADVTDHAYDSGVFLKRNSFLTNLPELNIVTPYASPDTIYEGCAPIDLVFSHPEPVPYHTNIAIGIGGTATNGVDYTYLSNIITIPADSTSVSHTIYAFADGIDEADEYLIINISGYCGLISSDTIWIKDNPFFVTLNDTTICEDDVPLTLTPTIHDGQAPYNFIWNTGDDNENLIIYPDFTSTYSVTVSDNLSCSASAEALITVNPLPDVYINPSDTSICKNEFITLTVYGSDFYVWSDGSTDSSITVSPQTTTIYSVTGTDSSGCSNSALATVNIIESPSLNITASPPKLCSGESSKLIVSGAQTYLWSTGETTSQIIVSPQITTSYTVTGSIQNCSDTKSITIEVIPNPEVNITASATHLLAGDIASLQAEGANEFLWYGDNSISCINCPTIEVSPLSSTEICVIGFNSICTDTACVFIEVDPCTLFIPNAFTPIKNSLNDVWQIFTPCPIDKGEIRIYNRWGKQIFYTTDLYSSWDGTFEGELVPPGVYSFMIRYAYAHTNSIYYTRKGTITILY